MKWKSLLGVKNCETRTSTERALHYDKITTYFFRDGDVNCLFANSSELYILNTSKQCKVNHKGPFTRAIFAAISVAIFSFWRM
jgi:hypothetical protein